MKAAVLFLALLAGCTDKGIPLTAEQRAICDAEGCLVITPKALQDGTRLMAAEQLAPIYEQGLKDGAAGCKKGAI